MFKPQHGNSYYHIVRKYRQRNYYMYRVETLQNLSLTGLSFPVSLRYCLNLFIVNPGSLVMSKVPGREFHLEGSCTAAATNLPMSSTNVVGII